MKNIFIRILSLGAFVYCFSTANVFAQQSDYSDFSTESLESNPVYLKNFNPIEYDPEILFGCILDVINLARQTYTFADPVVENDILASAAKFQSEYMAKSGERSLENVVGFLKTTELRSERAGGTKRVKEVVAKVKAIKDNARGEYSYLDIASEIGKAIFKSNKTAKIPLDKQYQYIGIGFDIDENNKNAYVSLVFGNDLSLNKEDITYKNTPYTRKTYKLKPYNEKTCRKCEIKGIEKLHKYIEVRGRDIYFIHPNIKEVKRLIGKKNDAITVDIVQHSQYVCNSQNNVDFNFPNRGIMSKPMKFKKLAKKNEIKERKNKGLKVFLGSLPSTVSGDFDVNLILIKDKTICRTLVKTNIHTPIPSFDAKTELIPDLKGVKTTINYIPEAEKSVLEFKIPFEVNKSNYEEYDIRPFIEALKEPRFIIDSIHIVGYTSFEGSEKANLDLQKERSESILNAMKQMQLENITYSVEQVDGYDLLVKDLQGTPHKNLASLSRSEMKYELNKPKVRKALEPILKEHRHAHVSLFVTYDISEKYEQGFVTSKFNKEMEKGNLPMAFAIERFMIKRVEEGAYEKEPLDELKIAENAKLVSFLTNKYYMLSFFEGELSPENMQRVISLTKLDPQNVIAEFNAFCCTIMDTEIRTASQIAPLQAKINKYYNTPLGTNYQDKVDALNITFQYKILDFINSSENPDENLMNVTYDKIKEIALPTITSWAQAFEVAVTFITHGDFEFARLTMDPYIMDESVSEDFIFTYMNLYSIDERTYTSKKFETACRLAAEKNRTRFCKEIRSYSYLVRENIAAKNIICRDCR